MSTATISKGYYESAKLEKWGIEAFSVKFIAFMIQLDYTWS